MGLHVNKVLVGSLLLLLMFGAVHGVTPQSTELSETCYPRAVLSSIYRNLHDAIRNHVIGCDSEERHVELLSLGKPLKYDSFNPGKRKQPLTVSQFGTLPISVVEHALPLVDKIFPTKTTSNTIPTKAQSDYNLESLSSTFSYILRHMMVKPKNFSSDEVLKAKYYLQELVPNSEKVLIEDAHSLPRLLLYDYYRTRYLEESDKRDSQINKNRLRLSQPMFEEWGKKELPPLMSNVDAAYTKWQVLGYKTEVEDQLQYFDVDRQEDKLMRTRALFRAAARSSEKDPHVTIYPFTFIPDDWYKTLKSDVAESADELRYRKALLQTERALLNASREELNNITSEDIKHTLEQINKSIAELDTQVQNAVDKLLQYEIECFTSVNVSACEVIVNGHTAFKRVLDKIAEHFEQAGYLQSLLESREDSVTIIDQKLQNSANQIRILDTKIEAAKLQQIRKDIDLSSNNNIETRSCPEEGKVHFTFDTSNVVLDSYTCSDMAFPQLGEERPYCLDERVPVNVSQFMLWNVASCSVDHQLRAFGLYDNFTKLMNSASAKVTASLSKVDIHRPWFDDNIFRDWEQFTMKNRSGVVSPGPLQPGRHYQEVVRSGYYLMPQFTSSLILASDINVYFPGLGIWNDSDTDDQTNNAVNSLMKYTYAPNLEGGYGPFSFVPADGAVNNIHSFRVERNRGGILITIPGAQIIGYITNVIPMFPGNQSLSNNFTESPCREPPSSDDDALDSPPTSNRRRRRSIDNGNEDTPYHLDVMQLAKSLFSEKLSESDSFLHRNGFITPIQSIHRLIDEVAISKDRVVEFIETLNSEGKDSRGDPASLYQNGTWEY